jgi:hypothetical protein
LPLKLFLLIESLVFTFGKILKKSTFKKEQSLFAISLSFNETSIKFLLFLKKPVIA